MLGEKALRGIVESAAVQGLLDVAATESILAARRRRGTPLLRRILSDWHPRGLATGPERERPDLRSTLEARLLALVHAAGLPTPHCNRPIDLGKERVVVDFLWAEQRLIVETDGERFHDNPLAFERDRRRDRVLQLNGYRVVRFTHRQVEREPDALTATVRRLLDDDMG
jgi:very-short-patch-repair endonuclease